MPPSHRDETMEPTTEQHDDGPSAGDEMYDLLTTASSKQATTIFPKTPEQTKEFEDILASEMEQLSIEDRDKLLFEMHGLFDQEEEEAKTTGLLEQMEELLQRRHKDKEAYLHAKYLNPAYVTDRKFLLMFLRCEYYDPRMATETMFAHFKLKRELFGDDLLGRDILQSDLSADDMESARSGFVQMYPTRDAVGRSIFFMSPAQRTCKTNDNVARALWYLNMAVIRSDEELQKKGAVGILFNSGKSNKNIFREVGFMKRMHPVLAGLPMKLSALHFCITDPIVWPFISAMRVFLPRGMRTRIRPHFGTLEDHVFKLQTYGIGSRAHPIDSDKNISTVWIQQWLEIQKRKEDSGIEASESVILPRKFDVLFGRGKYNREHPGNLRAYHLVDQFEAEYNKASKPRKTQIAEHIVATIRGTCNGRFLKWADHGWVEVNDKDARNKISHFFRQKRATPKEQYAHYNVEKVYSSKRESALHVGMDGNNSSKRIRE